MTNSFIPKELELQSVINEFENVELSFYEANIESAKLQAFYCHFNTIDNIKSYWLQLVSFLSIEVLTSQGRSFERLNTYILYSCSEAIPKSLQYEIENNKFSVRKMVYKKPTTGLTTNLVKSLLNKNILSFEVQLNSEQKQPVLNEIELSNFGQMLLEKFKQEENSGENEEDFLKRWLQKEIGKVV